MPSHIDRFNVEEYIEKLKQRTSGQYITQGVSFNKDSERQMNLLRNILISSDSFSGWVKEVATKEFQSEHKDGDNLIEQNNSEIRKENALSWV